MKQVWITIIVWSVIGVIAAAAVLPGMLRRRRERAAKRAALRSSMQQVVATLGLSEPVEVGYAGMSATGTLAGCPAVLEVHGSRLEVVRVTLAVPALPASLSLAPWPTGRAAEDIFLGLVTRSGHAGFDEHFGVCGAPEQLKQHATSLDPALLDVVAESYSTERELSLGPTLLRLEMPFDAAGTRPITAEPYIALWRAAEAIVARGIERGVFARGA